MSEQATINNKKNIYQAIVAIMSEVTAIAKTRQNAQQGYYFRGIDDAYNALHPLLAKHGVFIVPKVLEQTITERKSAKGGVLVYTALKIQHTFYASDGSSVECVTVGEAMDSGDKSSNKAMSAGMKYALLEVFAIPTKENLDTENTSHGLGSGNGQNKEPERPEVDLEGLKAHEDWLMEYADASEAIAVLSKTRRVQEEAVKIIKDFYKKLKDEADENS